MAKSTVLEWLYKNYWEVQSNHLDQVKAKVFDDLKSYQNRKIESIKNKHKREGNGIS